MAIDELEAFKRKIRKKINSFAQETKPNQTLVGGWLPYCFYQPHNYRLYFDFNKQDFNPKPTPKTLVSYKKANGNEHLFKFKEFTARVKKTQIEITNLKNHKRWYRIDLNTRANEQIAEIIKKKDKESIGFLKRFIKYFGGSSQFSILNRHSDEKIEQEEKIDLLPIKQKFHNEVVKKVYNEKNIEFSNPAFASNYITNRAIERLTPEIAQAITTINPLRFIIQNIKSINDLPKFQTYVDLLTTTEKEQLTLWFFERFGI